jgi:hypothetical protein
MLAPCFWLAVGLGLAVGCDRSTPPVTTGPPRARAQIPAPSSCIDEATASQEVTAADARSRAAFNKALADRGLQHVRLAPMPVDQPSPIANAPIETQVGKKGGRLRTQCFMLTGCCSRAPQPQTLQCPGGTKEPLLYRDGVGTIFTVVEQPRLTSKQMIICGTPPPGPCPGPYHGCGCPDEPIWTYVMIPDDLTYGGEISIAYDSEQLQLINDKPAPAQNCRP